MSDQQLSAAGRAQRPERSENPRRWNRDALDVFHSAPSLVLQARTGDAPSRLAVEVGVVVAQGQVFVRAHRGVSSTWYRATRALGLGVVRVGGTTYEVAFLDPSAEDDPDLYRDIDDAYIAKYGAAPSRGVRTSPGRDATVAVVPSPDSKA